MNPLTNIYAKILIILYIIQCSEKIVFLTLLCGYFFVLLGNYLDQHFTKTGCRYNVVNSFEVQRQSG